MKTIPRSCLSRILLLLCASIILLVGEPHAAQPAGLPSPGEEFPVVWWAQNHVKAALGIFSHTTWKSLGAACRIGHFPDPALADSFQDFLRNPQRQSFCRHYPGPTHHLLQEAPYFMVRPPGDQK